MATISQLMEGRAPGSVKVRQEGWDLAAYFVPYFQEAVTKCWHGLDEDGLPDCWDGHSDVWTLYTEPKRRVALYLWAVGFSTRSGNMQFQPTARYYATEDALRKANSDIVWCQRLDYTRIEVEEDV